MQNICIYMSIKITIKPQDTEKWHLKKWNIIPLKDHVATEIKFSNIYSLYK